jgi:amino acid adenylation domain-containing protein
MMQSSNTKPKAAASAREHLAEDAQWPLLAAQQGVWVAQSLDLANPRYNCAGYLEIHGGVDAALFRQAVRQAVAETEALRVRFVDGEAGPLQILEDLPEAALHVADLSGDADPRQAAEAWMRADLAKPADLGRAPLFAHALFKISDGLFFFYLRYHHIVMDGFGQTVYWRRLAEIYSALAQGEDCPATPFGPLAQLLSEDEAYRESPQFARDQRFWLDNFADQPEPARLAPDSALSSRGLLRRVATPPPASVDALREAARRGGMRWSAVALAATAAYLHRLTGVEDVILALPVSSRLTSLSRATPCMMANELPLRLAVRSDMSFDELLRQVSTEVGQVLAHQRYRGEALHRALKLSGSDRKLTGLVVNVISFDHPVHFAGCPTTAHYLSSGPVNGLLIGFYGKADASDLQIYFDANPDIYEADSIALHQRRLLAFLDAATAGDPSLPIGGIDILLPGERQQLDGYNATGRPYDLSACLHELIDRQAERTPDAPAVAVDGKSLSYRELVDLANRLAAHLRGRGVSPGDFVGVCELRSLEMVVDLLAVLKAGAAYVPIDPELPKARLAFQLSDAGIRCVLSRSALREGLAGLGVDCLAVDALLPGLPDASPPQALATPDSVAYVIYTSGSTGQPKGVMVPHRGVVNRLLWMQEEYGLDAGDCVLQKTPFTFDVSVWEFFWPLLTGARLFMAAPGGHKDPRYLAGTIRQEAVTTLHFVPPMLDLFLAEAEATALTSLRRVVCSGEALRPETVGAFFGLFGAAPRPVELHNLYGPTEASIDVTYWRCGPEDAHGPVPIGRPVANTQIHLLDAGGSPVPTGVPGELHIGGVQAALGYVNRPELSQEKFVPNPFGAGLLYRTGDLARYRKDGAIEFLGRLDHQIKLRGFRIELGESESALLAHPAVAQAAAIAWDRSPSDRRLVAYVVMAEAAEPAALSAYLAERLPEYMVPAHIVPLDALPLSPNGKLDRRALPEPALEAAAAGNAPPVTVDEQLLHNIWRDVLGIERFGLDDSFFALGGDSMLSIRVRAALEKHGRSFAVQDLFRFPTIRQLAKQLRLADGPRQERPVPFALVKAEDRARLPAGLEDAYPLSAMQGGMLYYTEFDTETAIYRVVTSLHVAAEFDADALRQAIADTFRRHPLLRTSFDLFSYSEPLQLVHQDVPVPLEEAEDLGGQAPEAQDLAIRAWVEQAKFRRFDSTTPPLLDFTVHRRGADGFQLSVVEHHVVLDGWSDAAMLEEIVARYRARRAGEELWLPAIPSRYADFIAAERRALANEDSRHFWTETLRGAETSPLPRRAARAEEPRSATHQTFDAPVSEAVAERLRALARQEGLPVKSLLTAAHVAVLRLACNSEEIVTGLVANGRLEEEGGDQVIGVFLNTLPLRIDTQGETLLSAARRVFAHEREAAPHRRYPFVQVQRDLGEQLQLESYVNFMDFHLQWQGGEGGSPVLDSIGVAETNFLLAANFLVDPVLGRLRLWLDCDVSALDSEFCERLAGYYPRALEIFAAAPETPIAELDLLGEPEKARIAAWNATAMPYERTLTIAALFELQAAQSPDAVALAHRETEWSYAALERRANQLAHRLRELGVRRGSLVGVHLRRGPDLVAALLAVFKAGGAYVPLDPGYPQSRLAFIAADAGIQGLISERGGLEDAPARWVLRIDADAAHIAAQPATPPPAEAGGEDAAYVIYTSGSTGQPKGTLIRHRSVVNFFAGMDATIGCGPEDAVLAVTSVSFDISVLELLWPLTRGAKIVIAGERLIENLVRDEQACAALDFSLPVPQGPSVGLLDSDIARFADQHGFGILRGWPGTARPAQTQHAQPAWLAPDSPPAAFRQAGQSGADLLTALPGQDLNRLAAKVEAYRQGRAASGLAGGRVSLLSPVCLAEDAETVRRLADGPLRAYLAAHDAFRAAANGEDLGLAGTADSLAESLRRLAAIGVDELACVVDFGQGADAALAALPALERLKDAHREEALEAGQAFDHLCRKHRVTLLQSTPSFLAAVAANGAALQSLAGARAILVGGEAFPVGLAGRLLAELPQARVFNMYGPTETTIWSTVHALDPARDLQANSIPIGRPIANTELLVLDAARRAVPVGVAGELWIGGDGVSGLYLGRPELTAERFAAPPQTQGLFYRTGDRVRWRGDGLMEFLGRVDRQVKILGHRVEPDEVESVLSQHGQVGSAAVVAVKKDNGSAELVAFVSPRHDAVDGEAESLHVRRWSEVWNGAYTEQAPGSQVADPDRLFAGWISSYDNEPIPADEMREWLAHTAGRIGALRPRAIIDVGVGVGLVLRELAPRAERYLGIDIAEAALRNARELLASTGPFPAHVALAQGDAGVLADLEAGAGDTVVLNSVVQYFPGTAYLERVLREAARVVGADGAVFVGDVRDWDLLRAFHATVQLRRAPALMLARDIASIAERQAAAERELCLSADFFRSLPGKLDGIAEARIELKRGHADNELTAFRYDVSLLGEGRRRPTPPGQTVAWTDLPALAGLEERLAGLAEGESLTVTGIPNRRLVRPLKLLQLLREAGGQTTAWDLERELWLADDGTAVEPEAVAELAARRGCAASLLQPGPGRLETFDAVFNPIERA